MRQTGSNACLAEPLSGFIPHLRPAACTGACLGGFDVGCHCDRSYDCKRALDLMQHLYTIAVVGKRLEHYCRFHRTEYALTHIPLTAKIVPVTYVCMSVRFFDTRVVPPRPHPYLTTTSELKPSLETPLPLTHTQNARNILTSLKELSAHTSTTTPTRPSRESSADDNLLHHDHGHHGHLNLTHDEHHRLPR